MPKTTAKTKIKGRGPKDVWEYLGLCHSEEFMVFRFKNYEIINK